MDDSPPSGQSGGLGGIARAAEAPRNRASQPCIDSLLHDDWVLHWANGMKPPSGRTVLLDTVASIAAYGAALAAVTFADPRLPREGSVVGGVLVWSVIYPVIHVAVLDEWPRFFGRRPWRYSLPNAVGLLAATAVYWAGFDAPDTFALALRS